MNPDTQKVAHATGQAIAVKYALDRLQLAAPAPVVPVVEAILKQQLAAIDILIDLLPRQSRTAIRRKANWAAWDGKPEAELPK